MTSIATRAKDELFTRPDEEHYPDMKSLREAAETQRKRCREVEARDTAILFSEDGGSIYFADRALTLTNYSLSQIAGIAKVPLDLLARVEPPTRASILNQTMSRERRFRIGLADEDRLRCVLSPNYRRVWDSDLLESVDRWLIGSGFRPATPTSGGPNAKGNTKPCLMRGDRSMFCLFIAEKSVAPGLGTLHRGVMLWNSEVGHRSLGFAQMTVRSICQNWLLHGVSGVVEKTARHTSEVRELVREFERDLRAISDEITSEEVRLLEKAAREDFTPGRDAEDAQDRLVEDFGVPRRLAADVVDAVFLPENVPEMTRWGVANGVATVAKGLPFADERARMMKIAGEILLAR
jgi:hypothetical protein